MNEDLLNLLYLSVVFLMLFGVSEFLYHLYKLHAEVTRKVVHIGTGLLSLLFPLVLYSHWHVLILCGAFFIILVLSMKFNLLKSINAIDRDSVGALAYPVSVYICYLAFDYQDRQYIYFYLPVLVLALCDPLAAFAGRKWPWYPFKVGRGTKTITGCLAFFASACILTAVNVWFYDFSMPWWQMALIALVATLAEALSKRGYDNLTIPVVIVAVMLGLKIFSL